MMFYQRKLKFTVFDQFYLLMVFKIVADQCDQSMHGHKSWSLVKQWLIYLKYQKKDIRYELSYMLVKTL